MNGKPTEFQESVYTVLYNYDKIEVAIQDDGKVVTQEQVKAAADAGTPIQMVFQALEFTIKGESQWEVQANACANKAQIVKG